MHCAVILYLGRHAVSWRAGSWLETKVCVLDFSDKPADRLLDLIYDAATDAELWASALIQIADVTSSVGGIVFGVDNGVHRHRPRAR